MDEAGFDRFVEAECAEFYAAVLGRPSLAPGRYFRLLLLGFFEGLDADRAIAWRARDSISIRQFLRLGLDQPTPDHSTISGTRRRIDVETHRAVFEWVLRRLVDAGLMKGRTLAIDATTLEANAAMRSIVRRDTGEGYEEFLRRLAEESGVSSPTRADLKRFDRKRKKKTGNKEWEHAHDPSARVAKMKDGRTRMAHKAEHAVDLESGALVAVTVGPADQGDTTTLEGTLAAAERSLEAAAGEAAAKPEVVADRGYHSDATMTALAAGGHRSYVPEPERGRRRWRGRRETQAVVYANRRWVRGARGKQLSKLRHEKLERSFAHCYETGGMRRVPLRGHDNILKRLLIHAAGYNLSILMRRVSGVGKPRTLQGRRSGLVSVLETPLNAPRRLVRAFWRSWNAFHRVLAARSPSAPSFAPFRGATA